MVQARRTIGDALRRGHVSRRSFLEFCTNLMVAAPFGLTLTDRVHAREVATEVKKARRPSVVWLHFQDCTGCTETLLASVRAMEDAISLEIPANAQAIRNLILIAHALHDHIVHFYQLSALDCGGSRIASAG